LRKRHRRSDQQGDRGETRRTQALLHMHVPFRSARGSARTPTQGTTPQTPKVPPRRPKFPKALCCAAKPTHAI
jgi:hypothetical protein